MEDSRAEFDKHDMELMETARRETDAAETAAAVQADEGTDPAAAPPPAPAPAQAPATAPAEAPPAAPAPSPAPAPAVAKDDGGSPRAALRASRHAERQLRDENTALRKQLEESGAAARSQAPKEPDETQLNDVREYAPEVGSAFDRLKAENERLRALAPAPAPVVEAFVPDTLPPDVQEAVDDNPTLLQWQSTPEDQPLWNLAKKADALLMESPLWKGRSYSERFAEAIKLVQAQTATPSKAPTPTALEAAKAAIAAAAAGPAAPVTLGDLRGGQQPASVSPRDPYEMVKAGKTDEEIMATLPAMP